MINVAFADKKPKCVAFIGAHCDDIEIGCGGTILELVQRTPDTRFVFITLSSTAARAAESRTAASMLLDGAAHQVVEIKDFRESYFPYIATEIKPYFEDIKRRYDPDIIFTHSKDAHQDHILVNALTWNTFRDHLIFEYAIPQYDGDFGVPGVFVPLTTARLNRKCEILLQAFTSQLNKQWFSRDTFAGLARLRGVQCNASEGFAEAFQCRKLQLSLGGCSQRHA